MWVKDERDSVMDGRIRLLVVFAGLLLMQTTVWGAALPKPTYTNKTKFRIPYKFDPAALERMKAREVQLHVSRDHGANWQLAQVREPDGDKFVYECPAEGEYWFAVKTLDGRMQLHPPRGSYETGLIVVVDNTPPSLEMTLQQAGAGRVKLNWQAADTNLDVATLRMEYLSSGSRDWEEIQADGQSDGQSTWSVPSGVVSVRGAVSDSSGNTKSCKAQIDVDSPNDRGNKARPSLKGPIAGVSVDADVIDPTANNGISNSRVPDPVAGEKGYRLPVITPHGAMQSFSNSYEQFPPVTSMARANANAEFVPAKTSSADQVPITSAVMGSSMEFDGQTHLTSRTSPIHEPPRRSGSRQRTVLSRRFQVGYSIEDVGPSGVGAVELYILTSDASGRKWWKYGDDPDQKSPFDVEVPGDGEYGFSIRVRSGAGLSSEPPVPGEPPEFTIVVDQTAPVVELFPVQQGQGANTNRLRIRWRIVEERPSDKPVSLYYAANRSGPWESISGWKEDRNGTFDWIVGAGVPSQFFIRVMARDAAGNISKAETPQAIIVDLARPTAQIIDIESPDGSGPQ